MESAYASSLLAGRERVAKFLASIVLGVASLGLVVPSAAAQSPSDREVAKAGLFREGDFPAGWRATPPKKGGSNLTAPSSCPVEKRAEGNVRKNRTAKVQSDTFLGPTEGYSSFVFVYRTVDVSRRVFDAVGSNVFHRCARRALQDAVKKNAGVEKAEERTVSGTGVYGDESSDVGFKFTLSNGTGTEDVFADLVFARVGRSIGTYSRFGTSETNDFDTPTLDGLITSATGRLTAATGGQSNTGSTQTTASASAAAAVRVP
jgi:hypothetical protein